MRQFKALTIKHRFDMREPDLFTVYGIWPNDTEGYALLNNERLDIKIDKWDNVKRNDYENFDSREFDFVKVSVKLPSPLPLKGRLQIVADYRSRDIKWFDEELSEVEKAGRNPQVFIEQIKKDPSMVVVSGWAASDKEVEIKALLADGTKAVAQVIRFFRPDVKASYPEADIVEDCGFQIAVREPKGGSLKLVFKNENAEHVINYRLGRAAVFFEKTTGNAFKGIRYLRKNGFKRFCRRLSEKFRGLDKPVSYKKWAAHNFPTGEELAGQRKKHFDKEPLISIVVPLYKTREIHLNALVNSIKKQTYSNWELCLSDGSGNPSPIAARLETIAAGDKRIKLIRADVPHRIVPNTNRATRAAGGEYIAFADHDDVLSPDALYEVVRAINKHNAPELIYSDEDKTDGRGRKFFEPHMKPDYNPDLLRTVNYICHLCVISRALLDKIGYLNDEFEGAQDYDLVLRATENTKNIHHIPKVLYHWRSHAESTAENPESKKYAFEAGRRAIQAHYDRLGIAAEVEHAKWDGLYKTKYIRAYDPLISIVIPNKDHIDDLERCISSICEKSTYDNFEIIVVENNSEKKETFEYYKALEAKNPKVRVVYYADKFNYSKINNFGVRHAAGEYLLLLNNDTSMINEDCLEELVGYCMRDDVGIVGARLYFEDDTIQHAGVVIGFGGIAGHCFINHKNYETGYCHRIICAQNYSAVTAACMMVDKRVYEAVGGMNEELAVAFNDIDFCLKVRRAGKLVVYNPYATMYHYESKSRGLEDTPEKVSRFNSEIATMEKNWPEILKNGDPYYNPNLTLNSQDFSWNRNW